MTHPFYEAASGPKWFATIDFLDLYLRSDARAFARLSVDAVVEGLTKLEYDPGSTGKFFAELGAPRGPE